MEPHKTAEFKEKFRNYLDRPAWNWTWFATQTFDKRKNYFNKNRGFSSFLCQNSWGDMMERLASHSMLVYGFWFQETHQSGFPHWHALLHVSVNLSGRPTKTETWKHMFERYGRSKIEQVWPRDLDRTATRVSNYLTKYVAKDATRQHDTWGFDGFIDGSKVEAYEIADRLGFQRSEPSLNV